MITGRFAFGGAGMGRLQSVPSRMAAAKPRLAQAQPVDRDARRRQEKPWRKWYCLKRWKDMRVVRLRLCQWRCERTGVLVIGRHPAGNSPVLDHVMPHRGDPDLFWDPTNVQIVAKAWHDKEKQKQESAGIW